MRNQQNRGFTLVELMVVIAIIGILASIVIVAINPQRILGEARDTKKREELLQVKNAHQLYYNDNNDYPDAADGNLNALTPNYMRQLPVGVTIQYCHPNDCSEVPAGEYRAAVELEYPSPDSAVGNDSNTRTKCDPTTIPAGWDDFDYFICPD